MALCVGLGGEAGAEAGEGWAEEAQGTAGRALEGAGRSAHGSFIFTALKGSAAVPPQGTGSAPRARRTHTMECCPARRR